MQETPAPLPGREDPLEEGEAPTPWLPVRAAGTEPPATAPWSPAPSGRPPGSPCSCARAPPGCCPPLAGVWLQLSFVCPGGWLVLVPCSRVFP